MQQVSVTCTPSLSSMSVHISLHEQACIIVIVYNAYYKKNRLWRRHLSESLLLILDVEFYQIYNESTKIWPKELLVVKHCLLKAFTFIMFVCFFIWKPPQNLYAFGAFLRRCNNVWHLSLKGRWVITFLTCLLSFCDVKVRQIAPLPQFLL